MLKKTLLVIVFVIIFNNCVNRILYVGPFPSSNVAYGILSTYHFEDICVGDTAYKELVITQDIRKPLKFLKILYDNPEYVLLDSKKIPINPNNSIDFKKAKKVILFVRYTPKSNKHSSGRIRIYINSMEKWMTIQNYSCTKFLSDTSKYDDDPVKIVKSKNCKDSLFLDLACLGGAAAAALWNKNNDILISKRFPDPSKPYRLKIDNLPLGEYVVQFVCGYAPCYKKIIIE